MRSVTGLLLTAASLALGTILPSAAATTSATPTADHARVAHASQDVSGAVGQPVTLDNEQVHTVVQVQRWYGGGFWVAPVGKALVTVRVNIKGLQKTSYNALYYSVHTSGGTSIGHSYIGSRDPSLVSSNDLLANQVAEGWITFLVPLASLNSLSLVYTMHSGFGSRLTVPLGTVPDSPRTGFGRTAVLQSEQAVTATRVERPARNGFYVPKKGYKFITVYAKVRALTATKTGQFTAFTPAGKTIAGLLLGHRTPSFPELRALARGKTVQGWVTLMVPQNQTHGLTLVYHLSGYRETLLIRIPG